MAKIKDHLKFSKKYGRYVKIERICSKACCDEHFLDFSEKMRKILGFEPLDYDEMQRNLGHDLGPVYGFKEGDTFVSYKPANLFKGLPNMLMIYTDIIEPIFTGNVHARLLRSLSINNENHTYGCTYISRFSPAMYMPLLFNSFQTIEIDIRDQHGSPLPFDDGTLTVILHFKRLD